VNIICVDEYVYNSLFPLSQSAKEKAVLPVVASWYCINEKVSKLRR
jgi:hypothetical protein